MKKGLKVIAIALALSLGFLGYSNLASAASSTATDISAREFTGTWTTNDGKEFAVTAHLKDHGTAAQFTINNVTYVFPLVGKVRCAGCWGVYGDNFDTTKQTVRFTMWSQGADNKVEIEFFNYNLETVYPGKSTIADGTEISLKALVSDDSNKALVSIDDSFYVLNKIGTYRCLGCVGIFADVNDFADADKAEIKLTLWNSLSTKGISMDVEVLNYDQLLNNAVTFSANYMLTPTNMINLVAYLTNDGKEAQLYWGTKSYKLYRVALLKCLGCQGQFADVETIADIKKAKIVVSLWSQFDAAIGALANSIKVDTFDEK